ncbi:MRPL9 [Auxenochlorella protothecoides x Auxenochlorella symbiontica]|uniref:Large ribosomal subunit protein bL9c n=1 Tax=Auxenochlorella protothecoides TaxID=3075 RepID=A0A1D2A532_AUXPR
MDRRQVGHLFWRCAAQLQQIRSFKSVSRKLDVKLLKDVNGLGESGSVVQVSAGYARNYLLPQKLAQQLAFDTSLSRRERTQQAAAALQGAGLATSTSQSQAEEPEAKSTPKDEAGAVMEKLKTPLVFKRKAEGLKLAVPLEREDVVEAVARQLRITLVPELLDIGNEKLSEVGEFLLPLKIVTPAGQRAQLEVHIAAT